MTATRRRVTSVTSIIDRRCSSYSSQSVRRPDGQLAGLRSVNNALSSLGSTRRRGAMPFKSAAELRLLDRFAQKLTRCAEYQHHSRSCYQSVSQIQLMSRLYRALPAHCDSFVLFRCINTLYANTEVNKILLKVNAG